MLNGKVLTSTEITSAKRIVGEERAVEIVAKAGFDAWDFSMLDITNPEHPVRQKDYIKYVKHLKRIGEDNGIHCNQSHAPCPTHKPEIWDLQKLAIECTAEAGGKICVIHPLRNDPYEENANKYRELLPFAKDCGVKIATENMWNWDDVKDQAFEWACSTHKTFKELVEYVNDPYLIACVDVGHAEMRGLNTSCDKLIRALGKHCQALHIHDNDLWHDDHTIPGKGLIDFNKMLDALVDINYDGYFTLEAYRYADGRTKDNLLDAFKELSVAVRKLANNFEERMQNK